MDKVVHNDKVHRQDYEDVGALAEENPERCKRLLDQRMATELPPQGQTVAPPGGDRWGIIISALREYDGDESVAKLTSREALANLRLRDKGRDPLSESEAEELVK